ncbi:cryptochrome/photolyase family protein [Gimibacter soli]|uniref:Deoxyribodipyrimidine photo-lyase n=1 Tax=Gimibacter soli TaxID=3024400 RepID=A0AAE9XSC5_9PROT|nr:deoxyribodipyrimidine photo-lyase [Gimibacter soli]WCL55477.1 deoxyribodipyrimidine photo-lyase [Gimibacter soli]
MLTTALYLVTAQSLRLDDNPALAAAAREADHIVPAYIHDETRPRPTGGAAKWWLHHALADHARDLARAGAPLVLRHGALLTEVEKLVAETGARTLYLQHDPTPGMHAVEDALHHWAEENGIVCRRFGGHLLFDPVEIRTGAGKPYSVFTPFWRACIELGPRAPIPAPEKLSAPDNMPATLSLDALGLLPRGVDWTGGIAATWEPGETAAHKRLDHFIEAGLRGYGHDRDFPALEDGTTTLSPYLRFGNISPRRLFARLADIAAMEPALAQGAAHVQRELGWREFCWHLAVAKPDLATRPIREDFTAFPWHEPDPADLKRWQRGQTGFPIIDAGMRQLWQTGWMHNRVRMIVASFLAKDMLTDWRHGEAWFWDTLVDADAASNPANWQWVAGCGADAAPFFRIFNPTLQSAKFDGTGDYIRRFVPELANLPDAHIHEPHTAPAGVLHASGVALGRTYPLPMLDRSMARARALDAYQARGTTP